MGKLQENQRFQIVGETGFPVDTIFQNYRIKLKNSVAPLATEESEFFLYKPWDLSFDDIEPGGYCILYQDYSGPTSNACRVGTAQVDYYINDNFVGSGWWPNTGYDQGGGTEGGDFHPEGLHRWLDNYFHVDPTILNHGINKLTVENKRDIPMFTSHLYLTYQWPKEYVDRDHEQATGVHIQSGTLGTDITLSPNSSVTHYIDADPFKRTITRNIMATAVVLYEGMTIDQNACRVGGVPFRFNLHQNPVFKRWLPNTRRTEWKVNFHCWCPTNIYFEGLHAGETNRVDTYNLSSTYTINWDRIIYKISYHPRTRLLVTER